ncbi:MAG: hypothetical protein JWL84_5939 [Rhodospirillales bacterium]|nr:hypothetical protein [Rhodospirillales bacterium]
MRPQAPSGRRPSRTVSCSTEVRGRAARSVTAAQSPAPPGSPALARPAWPAPTPPPPPGSAERWRAVARLRRRDTRPPGPAPPGFWPDRRSLSSAEFRAREPDPPRSNSRCPGRRSPLASLWSVRRCVRPVGAVHVTAGHNAFREDGSRPRARARRGTGANGFSRPSVSTGWMR